MSSPAVSVVPFAPPEIGPGEIAEVVATLESGWLSTGPRVHRFERAFADYVGAPHAIALNSCTAGLHLALLAAGIGPGDEVITSPLTFCATANVVLHAGATPVFADVDPDTGNLDPAAAEAAITPRTRAIMPVHYGGLPADVDAFAAIAARYGLRTIEDAAHCVEGIASGRKIGTTADYTCFSFYATKNLTTGEGGMVTTASAAGAERIRIASLHGMTRDAWSRYQRPGRVAYDVITPGFKYNMTDLQAAIGLHQLRAIDGHYERRSAICAQYDDAFAELPIGRFVDPPAGTRHAR
ncbi:MAG TPA: DegT/DnrJ/EryC1/StrS family aminotransferase, partial [Vicinamibacterales bacterium]|nr:DegT/DnrJ/EryC1/StrS family aminotransferase [Vicinamibacterales bacterium]